MLKAFFKKTVDRISQSFARLPQPIMAGEVAPVSSTPPTLASYWKNKEAELNDIITHIQDNRFSDADRLTVLQSNLDNLKAARKIKREDKALSGEDRELVDQSLIRMMLVAAREINKLKNIEHTQDPLKTKASVQFSKIAETTYTKAANTIRPAAQEAGAHIARATTYAATTATNWVKENWTPEKVADYLAPLAHAARVAKETAEQQWDKFKIWVPEQIEKVSRISTEIKKDATQTAAQAQTSLREVWNRIPKEKIPSMPPMTKVQKEWAMGGAAGLASAAVLTAFFGVLQGNKPSEETEPDAKSSPAVSATAQAASQTATPKPPIVAAAKAEQQAAASAPAKITKVIPPERPSVTNPAPSYKTTPYVAQNRPVETPGAVDTSAQERMVTKDGRVLVKMPPPVSKWNIQGMFADHHADTLKAAIAAYEALPRSVAIRHLIKQESGGSQYRRGRDGEIQYDNKGRPVVLISEAGALGQMQVMPDTAMRMARMLKMDVDLDDVKYNPSINEKLGDAYHNFLHRMYGGSNTMSALGYIMGEGNIDLLRNGGYKKLRTGKTVYVEKLGDPLKGEISMAEFIEKIPSYLKGARHYVPSILARMDPQKLAKEFGEDVTGPWKYATSRGAYANQQARSYDNQPAYLDYPSSGKKSSPYGGQLKTVSYQYNEGAKGQTYAPLEPRPAGVTSFSEDAHLVPVRAEAGASAPVSSPPIETTQTPSADNHVPINAPEVR